MNIALPCNVYIQFFRSERSSSRCSFTYHVFTKHSSNSCHCHHTLLEMNQAWVWFTSTSFHQNIKYHNDSMRTWKKPQNSKKRRGFFLAAVTSPQSIGAGGEAQQSLSYLWELPQESFPQNKTVSKSRVVDAAIKHNEGNMTCKYAFIWMKQRVSLTPSPVPLQKTASFHRL